MAKFYEIIGVDTSILVYNYLTDSFYSRDIHCLPPYLPPYLYLLNYKCNDYDLIDTNSYYGLRFHSKQIMTNAIKCKREDLIKWLEGRR